VITGAHAIVFTTEPDEARDFFRDKLGFSSVDAGGGWLIFNLPPAELGIHPSEAGSHQELYLLCDDIESTMEDLRAKGVEFTQPVSDQRWGLVTAMKIPGGELSLYEPRHPTAIQAS
jgi:catechol 2,3-dioxygenase-like lactoylglutathione lyase family enzyme